MKYYIGVMSGTSLDGIDIAITRVTESANVHFIAAQTVAFPDALHSQLQVLITEQRCHLQQLGNADIVLGQFIAQSINELLKQYQLSAHDISAIGCHGQTLFHCPSGESPFSQQIGNANVIAENTGITTVADFRQRDIAAGGQGAPLVPAFHQALFSSADEDRVIVNIGGISNLTILPCSNELPVIGFDTGPGNTLIDCWTKLHLDKPYDAGGQWAKSGQFDQTLLSVFLNDPYFKQAIPKSSGRELFNQSWLENNITACDHTISAVDVQATLLELTALTISTDINTYARANSSVFICGGGAHNDYLFNRLQSLLSAHTIATTESLGLDPDWVEACAFAWLAYRTMNQKVGNLPSVTGAAHAVVLGAIYPA